MRSPRPTILGRSTRARSVRAVVLAGLVVASAGCSRPDENPPIRITGDPDQAVPVTDPTTTTSTTVAPSTTLFWGPDGPGATIPAEG